MTDLTNDQLRKAFDAAVTTSGGAFFIDEPATAAQNQQTSSQKALSEIVKGLNRAGDEMLVVLLPYPANVEVDTEQQRLSDLLRSTTRTFMSDVRSFGAIPFSDYSTTDSAQIINAMAKAGKITDACAAAAVDELEKPEYQEMNMREIDKLVKDVQARLDQEARDNIKRRQRALSILARGLPKPGRR